MKFSIITPTFNRAHTIERAIKSIKAQTYKNWELIIVDDGSTDDTYKVINPYLKEDKRIKYIKLNRNYGVNKARNVGLQNISEDSEWVTFLDSDDIFLENALELMLKKIKEFPKIKWFAFSTIYENGNSASKLIHDNLIADYSIILGKDNMAKGEFVNLLHRSLIEEGFSFEEKVNGYEWIAWLRLAKKGVSLLYTATTVRIYTSSSGSLTRTKKKNRKYYENMKQGLEILVKEFGEDLKKANKKKYARYIYALANVNILLGFKKEGILQTLEGIKCNIFDIRWLRNFINLFK